MKLKREFTASGKIKLKGKYMKHNACMVSFFVEGANPKTIELQRAVVDKLNVSKYPLYQIKTDASHPISMDYFWCMNGLTVDTLKQKKIPKQLDHEIILFLDLDAIPVSETAIDLYVERAAQGHIAANAQRSNHIENGKHVFAAPSSLALSADTFVTIGKPSALQTKRGDVAEEYTYKAEESKIVPIDLFMPVRYDSPPFRMSWESADLPPYWPLADGMPNYGIGTTYGDEENGDLFWHCFQIYQPGQQERFHAKCESILANKV